MLEDRSQRSVSNATRTSTGSSSRGVLFPADLAASIEKFVEENFPTSEYPTLKVGWVLTGLMYSGIANPEALKVVTEYINTNAPNSKVSKAMNAVEQLTDEEKLALIKRLGLA